MPRPLRVHVPGGFYHVTLRGNHGQKIFFRPAHRRILECIVREAIARFDARVHAYCWMTNHIHLLIQVGESELSRIMLRIASRYARFVQARLDTTGHLFERRYHAVLVDEDAYLLTLLRYIHQNPLKAGMVNSLTNYPWSSHHAYAGTRRQSWVTTQFALGMLHTEYRAAVSAYLQIVGAPVASADLEPHRDDPRILGDDRFLLRFRQSHTVRSMRSLDDLMAEACTRFAIDQQRLQSPGKERAGASARAWLAHQAVALRVATICEVARRLDRHESSIRGLMRRYRNK